MQFQDFFPILVFFSLAAFLSFIYPLCKGWFGEKTVAIILSTLPQKQYQVINNVMLRKKSGKTTQIDHVVISPYGIFVLETKNYRGYITGSELLELPEEIFVPIVVFSVEANVKVQSKKSYIRHNCAKQFVPIKPPR